MISPWKRFAAFTDNAVFPTAVGPVKIKIGFFKTCILSDDQTIRLNFFSSSRLLMEMMVGLP